MKPRREQEWIRIGDLRGGQVSSQPPQSLAENQCVAAQNVDWDRATFARKRNGTTALGMTSYAGADFPGWMYLHSPSGDETAVEVWTQDQGQTNALNRLAGGTTWASVSLSDTNATGGLISAVSFNGKLFLAYDSSQDRNHVWDGSSVRRMGLKAPTAAPTISKSAGTPADTRKYRSVALHISGSDTVRRSEPSTAGSAETLASQRATMTFAGAPSEGETHWELQVASDDDSYATWWVVGQDVVANTIVDNNASVTALEPADESGLYTNFPSVRYLLVGKNRILGAGAYESTSATLNSRVWFSPVLGSADIGDDERYINTSAIKGYVDVERGAGGRITGMGGPLFDAIYVFKRSRTYKLVPTLSDTTPFQVIVLDPSIGCINHRSIASGQDETGNPCLYFMSRRGPYRVGVRGLEYLGWAIEDVWASANMNAAERSGFHTLYYPARHQVWWWFAVDSGDNASVLLIYDVRLKAWSRFTGNPASASSAALLPATVGASMSFDRKPYVGSNQTTNKIYKCDTGTNDDSAGYQAFITTKPYNDLTEFAGVNQAFIEALAQSATTIQLTIVKDFGLDTRVSTASIAASGSETRVRREFGDSKTARARALQFTIGDASATTGTWTLDAFAAALVSEGM